jgi:N-acetylglutamate synthase-like GNAT family acetyltransferase
MTVRGYRDADRDACRALWLELTQTHRDLYSAPEIGGDDPGSYFDEHLELVGADNVWVAERDGTIVGFTAMISKDSHAELEPIVVSGECRGQGIGRALAEVVISTARERGMRQVIVRPVGRNAEAIGFFHARGFEAVGQIELILDLVDPGRWRAGERFAGRDFRV